MERQRVVFTNGCFDMFHVGHLNTLQFAYSLARPPIGKLIVGINSDRSISLLKGESRPIITENHRKRILESLWFDMTVYIFDEETPYELMKKLNLGKDDTIVKGHDYKGQDIVGSDLSSVVFAPKFDFVSDISTSKIVEKILAGNE